MGNILTQKRNGGGASATALDELTYNYHTTTDGLVSNRLYQVNDVVSAGNYTDDIDDQGTFNNTHSTIETANNYGYDELGNLVRDVQEEIASIEWTVYGKMKKITRNSGSSKADLEFGYDASGNRLWKKVTPKGSGAVTSTYYYLRDAQGNEMCRYVKYTNTSSQLMYVAQEHSIYGSSRVGVDNRKDTLYKAGSYSPAWGGANTSRRALGLKSFELSNHLGNVLVTISDKPIYKVSSTTIFFNPEITSISDYYPFGAPIQGRSFSSAEYRFGFNGKEKDDEVNGEGNSYDFGARVYSARLGRWLSVDREFIRYSSYSQFCFAGNSPILFNDKDGKLIVINYETKREDGSIQQHSIPYTPGIKPADANDFVQKVHLACTYAMNSPTGKAYWTGLSTATNDVGKNIEVAIKWGNPNESAEFAPPIKMEVNPENKAIGYGIIRWNPDTEGIITEVDPQSLNVILQAGYQAPSTALFHEICHALRYANNPIQSLAESRNGTSDKYDNKEDEKIITGPERKYIQEINNFEKSRVSSGEKYQIQTIRFNHEWKLNILPVENPNVCSQLPHERDGVSPNNKAPAKTDDNVNNK